MPIDIQVLLKDIVFAAQSYLYWSKEFESEHEWSASKNADSFRERLETLVPKAVEWYHDHNFDDACG